MKKMIYFAAAVMMAGATLEAGAELPPAPAELAQEFLPPDLDPATMKKLASEGYLIVVRQAQDLSLINITVGRLVKAPAAVVWGTVTDFENWPRFVDRTKDEKVLRREDDNHLLVSQTLAIKVWRLPSIDIESEQVYALTPPAKVRFWHTKGPLLGSYGGWDIVPLGNDTILFYSLYSNLYNLGLGLGSMFRGEPDFMAGINVTTAMLVARCVQEEAERRARQ
jgi:ribosome-associated toxin RatA of RatAB toxin-antitoxin module